MALLPYRNGQSFSGRKMTWIVEMALGNTCSPGEKGKKGEPTLQPIVRRLTALKGTCCTDKFYSLQQLKNMGMSQKLRRAADLASLRRVISYPHLSHNLAEGSHGVNIEVEEAGGEEKGFFLRLGGGRGFPCFIRGTPGK